MGAGLALECRFRYPDMYNQYVEICDKEQLKIGMLWLYKSDDKWVLNFPTKKHWRYPSKEEYLSLGLKKFVSTYKERGITSIAFPMLGADRGGLSASLSLKIMREYLDNLDIEIEIYKYDPSAHDDLYQIVKDKLLSQSPESIAHQTNIRINYVKKVVESMQDPTIVQMNQLGNIKGIGVKTLEKLFQFSCSETQLGLGL